MSNLYKKRNSTKEETLTSPNFSRNHDLEKRFLYRVVVSCETIKFRRFFVELVEAENYLISMKFKYSMARRFTLFQNYRTKSGKYQHNRESVVVHRYVNGAKE